MGSACESNLGIQPLDDMVLLFPDVETITKGGIVLPDTGTDKKPTRAVICAIGPGKINKKGERDPISVRVGDRVIFQRYAGTEIKIDGKAYLLVRATDILAVITDNNSVSSSSSNGCCPH